MTKKIYFPIFAAALFAALIVFLPQTPTLESTSGVNIPDELATNLSADTAIPFATVEILDFECLKTCKPLGPKTNQQGQVLKYRNFNISVANGRFNNQESLQFIVRGGETIFLYFNGIQLDAIYTLSIPQLGISESLDPEKTNILAIPIPSSGEFEISLSSVGSNNPRAGIIKIYE